MKIKSSVHSHVCSVRPWFALSESFFSPSWWFFFFSFSSSSQTSSSFGSFRLTFELLAVVLSSTVFQSQTVWLLQNRRGDVIISVQTIIKMHHSNCSTHMPAHGRQEEDKLVILCRARQHLHKQKHVWTTAFNYPKKWIACGCHVAV